MHSPIRILLVVMHNFLFDNHYNTLFAQNLKLGASGGSGNHNIEIINQHSTIGGATGMYIGGNGSNQQTQLILVSLLIKVLAPM